MGAAILAIFPSLVDLVRKFIPDRAQQDAAVAEISTIVNEAASKVGDAMIIDANSQRFFNSGWRPALGWIGAAGLAMHYLIFPLVGMFFDVRSPLDVGGLLSLVLALLGLGGLRTVERVKGKA